LFAFVGGRPGMISGATGTNVRTVGDIGTITRELPFFYLSMVSLNLETLAIIFPYSVTLAIVGITFVWRIAKIKLGTNREGRWKEGLSSIWSVVLRIYHKVWRIIYPE
jgi:hypothetical protein